MEEDADSSGSEREGEKQKTGRAALSSSRGSEPINIQREGGGPSLGAAAAAPTPSENIIFGALTGWDGNPAAGLSRARGKELVQALQTEDETNLYGAVLELSEYLSMSTEESLSGFPLDLCVSSLLRLLNYEHQPELMLMSVRALTHLLDAQPATAAHILQHQGVGVLCAKLLNMEYIDLAEQALQALHKLSLEMPQPVLKAGGLQAVLNFLDFFPLSLQRIAMQTAANLCRQVPADAWPQAAEGLPGLVALVGSAQAQDARLLEQALLALVRLAEQFAQDEVRLQAFLATPLPAHLIRLLSAPPSLAGGLGSSPAASSPLASSNPSQAAYQLLALELRLLAALCRYAPALVRQLLRDGLAELLVALAFDSLAGAAGSELASSPLRTFSSSLVSASPSKQGLGSTAGGGRASQELLGEALLLLLELLPPLPQEAAAALLPGQAIAGRLARVPSGPRSGAVQALEQAAQAKEALFREEPALLRRVADAALPQLLRAYGSCAHGSLRVRLLAAVARLVHGSPAEALRELLRNLTISAFVASLLTARDQQLVHIALYIGACLLEKLPHIFAKYFRREGVLAEVLRIASAPPPSSVPAPPPPPPPSSFSSSSSLAFLSTSGSLSPVAAPATAGAEGALSQRELARRILEQMRQVEEEGEGDGSGQRLRQLTQLAARLRQGRETEAGATLRELAAILCGEEGVSTYEFLSSDLVPALLAYLLADAPAVRRAHTRALLDALGAAGLAGLVRKAQEALNKVERFPVWAAETSGGPALAALLKLLSVPFKVRLQRHEDEQQLREYPDQPVMVEPLASFAALEAFLYEKVRDLGPPEDSPMPDVFPPAEDDPSPAPSPAPAPARAPPGPRSSFSSSSSSSSRVAQRVPRAPRVAEPDSGGDEGEDESESREDENEEDRMEEDSAVSPAPDAPPAAAPRLEFEFLEAPAEMRGLTSPQTSLLHALKSLQEVRWVDQYGPTLPYRRLWDQVHVIKYRRAVSQQSPALGPASGRGGGGVGFQRCEDALEAFDQQVALDTARVLAAPLAAERTGGAMPYLLLQLLRLLEGASRLLGVPVGAGEFLNAQVSGKLARQLQDPLALVSRSLPDWCPQVMREAPFLLPFELRRLYLLASSVGVARSLALLQATLQAEQGAAAPQIMLVTRGEGGRESVAPPRVPKRKVRISRERILESAQRVLELESPTQARNAVLEVEYFGEVGTGLGPTLEFFTLVSRDLQRRGLGLWYGDVPLTAAAAAAAPSPAPASASEEPDAYLQAGSGAGLFPLAYRDPPAQVLERFRFLGRFVGKALLDQRTLDLRFSPAFLRRAVHGEALTPLDLRDVSPELARQFDELRALVRRRDELLARGELEAASALGLREGSRVVDLGLDFSVPGHPGWEMQPGAPLVTIDNLHEYLDEACEHLLGRGIQRQVEAFRAGLAAVLPVPGLLRGFSLEELELLLNGDPMVESAAQWTPEALQEVIQADHGYSLASRTLRSLLEVLGEMSPHERRLFLQFVTGSPRLPLGGLRALQPRLTVVRKEHVPPLTPDHYLPSVMTCANYLKLPDYSSKEILRTRLMTAVHEGLSSFHLS